MSYCYALFHPRFLPITYHTEHNIRRIQHNSHTMRSQHVYPPFDNEKFSVKKKKERNAKLSFENRSGPDPGREWIDCCEAREQRPPNSHPQPRSNPRPSQPSPPPHSSSSHSPPPQQQQTDSTCTHLPNNQANQHAQNSTQTKKMKKNSGSNLEFADDEEEEGSFDDRREGGENFEACGRRKRTEYAESDPSVTTRLSNLLYYPYQIKKKENG